jgi:hypothetical protein
MWVTRQETYAFRSRDYQGSSVPSPKCLGVEGTAHPTPSLRAQAIRRTLVETGTGTPVDGAAIVLLDEADAQISWWLTDPFGRFSFIL